MKCHAVVLRALVGLGLLWQSAANLQAQEPPPAPTNAEMPKVDGLPKAIVDGNGPGWVALGEQDFAHVNCNPETWSFKDGIIHCTGLPIGVMRTTKQYTNFELVVEWKHLKSGGNSGVFVWAPEEAITDLAPNKLPPGGIEVQVLDHGYLELYEQRTGKKPTQPFFSTNGDVFPVGKSTMTPFAPTSPTGARSFPRAKRSKGINEWNHYYVRGINGEVRLWVNGEEVSGGRDCEPSSGYLCLESEGSPVEFRNLRIRELPTAKPASGTLAARKVSADVVVYGGTCAAVTAAIQAKKMGLTAIIVSPDKHLGGLSSGGLGFTDTGNKAVIGGLSREFYHRVYMHYQSSDAWTWQKQEEYGNKGQGTPAIDGEQRTQWIFEPHVAEKVFEKMVADAKVPVHRDEWLNREVGVTVVDGKIVSITTHAGSIYFGKMFIDATYEGDLMAAAGVKFHVGREAKATYGEEWNGIQVGTLHHKHHFGAVKSPIDPSVKPGDPKSGLLPRISADPPGNYGEADNKVQAYCFRMCLTNDPRNRIPFTKPAGYDPKQHELALRVYQAGWREQFEKFDPIPNYKTDTNNHGPFSTDNIGYSYDYPEASYERRREIIKEHEQYQKGLMYFLANDPRMPEDVRKAVAEWGLAADEFVDNGYWPHQIYVREARRMIGRFVMTENELVKRKPTPESIGMGSYGMDSHNVQRYVTPEGFVQNEGDIGVSTKGPYGIALGSIQPKKEQCQNLLVPVAVSSSHIAYGSIRMEPVFMILGQSAATNAALAISQDKAVQDVEYAAIKERLLQDGQVLEYVAPVKGKK